MPSRTQERARQKPAKTSEAPSTAVVPFDPKERGQQLAAVLEDRRDQIVSFLGGDPATAQRFLTVALDTLTKDQGLMRADLASIVASVRHAAIMGLEPTSVMGEGAIVSYRDSSSGKSIAQFQPMVRGLAKLARNSGQVAAIGVDVVHEKDEFDYASGSSPEIVHRPFIDGDPGAAKGAYAYARLTSGELIPLYMSVADIHKRRQVSKSWQSSGEKSIWGSWPEEMMKKTVLRRLLVEKVPLSFRAQRALALDAEIDSVEGDPAKVENSAAAQLPSRTAMRLMASVDPEAAADERAAMSGLPEPAQNGPTAADEVEGAAKDVTGDTAAPAASETGTEPICGKPGPKSDTQRCTEKPGHEPPHGDGTDSWL